MPIPESIDLWFWINEEVLRKLDIPFEEIDISLLENNLDISYLERIWTDDWNLSPRELIARFQIEKKHAKKVKNADISFPIEIYKFKWKWIILDWVHRYTKIIMSWYKKIKVRKITEEMLPKIKKSDLEFRRRKWEIK